MEKQHLLIIGGQGGETTTPDKEINVTVKPSGNGVASIVVDKLDSNSTNIINTKVDGNFTKAEVKLNDIEAIKTGKGAVEIRLNNSTSINLPFSTIDSKLLEGAKNVSVKFSTTTDNDILKNIKGINKVFNFDLIVEKDNGTLDIHNFASGSATVTLTLTDEDFKGLDRSKVAVFYYNESTKKFELMETSINGNNVTFKTSHFSKFIIAEKASTSDTNGNTIEVLPQTGSSATAMSVLAALICIVGGSILILRKRHI